ncbi:MAG: aminocyclopropane-1-carboxylate deaminase/D-cysteine desulfhydrase family protein [Ignavibacterium sp.]
MNYQLPPKLSLANLPTPLQKIKFKGKEFLIKRDDLTGMELSGNKIRKLEYLLYQAKNQGAEIIFTCGGEQSNHARATAFAATSIGLKTKLFLWGKNSKYPQGNLFLNKFIDTEIKFISKKEYLNINKIMEIEKKNSSKSKNVFIIPEGGSTPYGIMGYVNVINELLKQIEPTIVKGILIAAGSGGTAAGLLLGASINNLNWKIFAVNVLYDKIEIQNRIFQTIENTKKQFNLNVNVNEKNLEILDGYSIEGYKNISYDKIKLIKSFAKETGIILDPTYTGKAFFAYYDNFLKQEKNSDILFIHTGGLFGIFNKTKRYLSV